MNFTKLCLGAVLGSSMALAVLGTMGCSSDTTPASSSGTSGTSGATGTLYDRLGKKAGITKAVNAIVDAELKDPDIVTYFFFQTAPTLAAGHPTKDQVGACFVQLLAKESGGPEKYPAAATTETAGFTCRDMVTSHKTLGIPSAVFDNFITIAGGVLKSAGVADADITVIANVLKGTKTDVAQDTSRTTGKYNRDGG